MTELDCLRAEIEPGERLAASARHTSTSIRVSDTAGTSSTTGDACAVEVTSYGRGGVGRATAGAVDPASLRTAVRIARTLRGPDCGAAPDDAVVGPEFALGGEAGERDAAGEIFAALVSRYGDGHRVTVASTRIRESRWSSETGPSDREWAERQVHARSVGRGAVQSAWLGATFRDYRHDEFDRDLARRGTHLNGRRVPAAGARWLLLSPLVAASLLSRIRASVGASMAEASLAWAGSCAPPSGDVPPVGPQVALTLRPNGWPYALPPGPGLVVESTFGGRGGSAGDAPLQSRMDGGWYVDGRLTGTGGVIVTATAERLLSRLAGIADDVRTFRVHGLVGGSWWLFDQLDEEDTHDGG